MARKKATAKAAVKASSSAKGSQHLKGLTPNDLAEPQTPADHAALAVTCSFLGKTYYLGDKVCWQNVVWVCTADGWDKTGQAC
jgi:hypothetical protein